MGTDGVKWIKLDTNIFNDEKMLIIDSLPNSDQIIVIWFKLLALAGQRHLDGILTFADKIPYTDDMLSAIFRRDKLVITTALNVFEELGMIEKIDNAIIIPNWQKHQNLKKCIDRNEYMRNYMKTRRANKKLIDEKDSIETIDEPVNVNVNVNDVNSKTDVNVTLARQTKTKRKTKNKDSLSEESLKKITTTWNDIASVFGIPRVDKLNKARKSLLSAHSEEEWLNAFAEIPKSKFLQGNAIECSWSGVTFDWIIQEKNFVKVVEGNYRDSNNKKRKQKTQLNFNQRNEDMADLQKKLLSID